MQSIDTLDEAIDFRNKFRPTLPVVFNENLASRQPIPPTIPVSQEEHAGDETEEKYVLPPVEMDQSDIMAIEHLLNNESGSEDDGNVASGGVQNSTGTDYDDVNQNTGKLVEPASNNEANARSDYQSTSSEQASGLYETDLLEPSDTVEISTNTCIGEIDQNRIIGSNVQQNTDKLVDCADILGSRCNHLSENSLLDQSILNDAAANVDEVNRNEEETSAVSELNRSAHCIQPDVDSGQVSHEYGSNQADGNNMIEQNDATKSIDSCTVSTFQALKDDQPSASIQSKYKLSKDVY